LKLQESTVSILSGSGRRASHAKVSLSSHDGDEWSKNKDAQGFKMRRGFRRRTSPVKILSDCEVEATHRSTLDLLEEVGCRFEREKALDLSKQNSCVFDYEEFRARIPAARSTRKVFS
jgi:trimethylamine:corrinoid methyltransferase-like protein